MKAENSISNKRSKLGYLSGPVDAREIYESLHNRTHTSLFGTSYMRHLMQVCEEQGRDAVIITTHPGNEYDAELGRFTVLNRPSPGGRALQYHVRQARWTRRMLREMEARGVGVVVLTAAQHHWFVTPAFRKRGMRFINSYHCAVRALGHKTLGIHELLIRLTSIRHLRYGDPTMAVSPRILRQLESEAGSKGRSAWQIIPDYERTLFDGFEPKPIDDGPVNVLFAGRVEVNKGVFDLLKACERLNASGTRKFRFHIHGKGSALEELKMRAGSSPVADSFVVHGFTAGNALAAHYSDSHIVVVPTRSDFDEGLPKSVVEGVLALRPVVTSRACPIVEVVADACEEAQVNDADSYADAIFRLVNDPELLASKIEAARLLREQFFNPTQSYAKTLRSALAVTEGCQ